LKNAEQNLKAGKDSKLRHYCKGKDKFSLRLLNLTLMAMYLWFLQFGLIILSCVIDWRPKSGGKYTMRQMKEFQKRLVGSPKDTCLDVENFPYQNLGTIDKLWVE
jgi:hypothetical protein